MDNFQFKWCIALVWCSGLSTACGVAADVSEQPTEPFAEGRTGQAPPEYGTLKEGLSGFPYGLWCEPGAYENKYLPDSGCNVSGEFISQYDVGAGLKFFYNLRGAAKYHLEKDLDSYSMEQVDLALFEGHSNFVDAVNGVDFGLWKDGNANYNERAFSRKMKLGEENASQRGLSVFAAYSCNTVDIGGAPASGNDGSWYADWYPAFSGGLRLFLGSTGNVPLKPTMVGYWFGEMLRRENSYKHSWVQALGAASGIGGVTAAMIASGNTAEECHERINTMDRAWHVPARRPNPNYLCAQFYSL
jgi:hypothetical protein